MINYQNKFDLWYFKNILIFNLDPDDFGNLTVIRIHGERLWT